MDFKKHNWKKIGRNLLLMLFVCGLSLTFMPEDAAASEVYYRYTRVTKASQLPTGDGWHDYIIAWEDDGDYWFPHKEYFEDGDSNFDERSSWFEIKSNTRLSDIASGAKDMDSFTSEKKYGHMQIQFVGYDSDNRNDGSPAPMYRIRFSKANGSEYYYLDRTDFEEDMREAQAYTVQDKTHDGEQCFHIFINLHDLADYYLTRDDEYLESGLSSSSTDSECALRLYKVQPAADYDYEKGGVTATGNVKINDGWEYYYRYTRIDDKDYFDGDYDSTPHRLHYSNLKDRGSWIPIVLAWRSVNGELKDGVGTNGSEVYFMHNIFMEEGEDDYNVYNYLSRFYMKTERRFGSDRYTSAEAGQFVTQEKLGNFQMNYHGKDEDNYHHSTPDGDEVAEDGPSASGSWGSEAPMYYFRFWNNLEGEWYYLGKKSIESNPNDARAYTVVMRDDPRRKNDPAYGYGSSEIFVNVDVVSDYVLTRHGNNQLSNSRWNACGDIERQAMIYVREDLKYMAIVQDFTIGSGATVRIDEHVVLKDGVKLTVENGGLLIIDHEMYFNGEIEVKEGGTLVINSGGAMLPYINPDNKDKSVIGRLDITGGNVIVMENARLYIDEGNGILNITRGGSLVNWGLVMVQTGIRLVDNAKLVNQPGGIVTLGKIIRTDRGALHSLTIPQILDRSENAIVSWLPTLLMEDNAQFVNSGTFTVHDFEHIDSDPVARYRYIELANADFYKDEAGRVFTHVFDGTAAWCADNAAFVQKRGGVIDGQLIVPLETVWGVPSGGYGDDYEGPVAIKIQGGPRADYDYNLALENLKAHQKAYLGQYSRYYRMNPGAYEKQLTSSFDEELSEVESRIINNVFRGYYVGANKK